jgi:hypothetical protein
MSTNLLRPRWDDVAATYDLSPEHFPHTKAQEAAWNAALTWHLPPPPARILGVGAGALSARRFSACDTIRDPRTVAPLPDLVRWSRRSQRDDEGGKRKAYAFAALHMSGGHGPWCGDRRRRIASFR